MDERAFIFAAKRIIRVAGDAGRKYMNEDTSLNVEELLKDSDQIADERLHNLVVQFKEGSRKIEAMKSYSVYTTQYVERQTIARYAEY